MKNTPKGYRQTSSVIVDPGGSWGARLARGELVRFVDVEGQQAVDFLCYNALDARDRYNAANTMKMSENVFVNAGTVLYGDYATALSPSKAGDFVDVEALTDVITAISNCPQKYNPACGYNPSPVRVETWTRQPARRATARNAKDAKDME